MRMGIGFREVDLSERSMKGVSFRLKRLGGRDKRLGSRKPDGSTGYLLRKPIAVPKSRISNVATAW